METKTVNTIHNNIFGKPKKTELPQLLFNINGVATSTFTHIGNHGEQEGFKGDFFATNPKTGEIIEGRAAFLPKQLSEDVKRQLDNGNNEVRFSASIVAVASNKNVQGYAYIAEEPETEERQARRAELLEMAQGSVKAIAAPAAKK